MGLFNAVGQGLSAAGYAAGDYFARSALMDQQSALDTERAKRLEEFKQQLHDAPLNRLSAQANELAGQDVPAEPNKVTSVGGEIPLGAGEVGPNPAGFRGDLTSIRAGISALPPGADRDAAQAQLDRQVAGQTDFENRMAEGKTRKRTSGEALFAAVDEAKAKDLPAYAAYESQVGKPARDERRVDIAQQREDNRASAADASERRRAEQDARKYAIDMARLDLQQGNLDAQNKKIDAMIEHWDRSDDAKEKGKSGSPERLYSIVNAMNQTIKNLQDGSKGSTPEAKSEWQRQYDTAVRVRDRASQLLDDNLGERGAPPPPAPAPAARPAGTASRPPLSSFLKK